MQETPLPTTALPLLEARGLSKRFATGRLLRPSLVRAVEDVSFGIGRGEVVALVGESGSGKSTIARLIARLLEPSAGELLLEGRDVLRDEPWGASRAYRRRVQMIFQDPFASLNPAQTIAHHLRRPLRLHGRVGGPQELRDRIEALLTSVGLAPAADFARKLPHELSGGQRQRVAIARALAVEPELILADEPVSMLDVSVRIGILNLFERLKAEQGIAWLYITHDLASARYLADRILVMYAGRLVEAIPSAALPERAAHPYTRLLLASVPQPRGAAAPPRLPDGVRPPSDAGCPFAPSCPEVMETCRREVPPRVRLDGEEHWVRCQLYSPATADDGSESAFTISLNEVNPFGLSLAAGAGRGAMSRTTFPSGFLWGAATSAYQIEGAVREDGRGESIWDRFCRTPGRVEGDANGDVACDHYHRYRDDVELMSGLGLKAYRFSVAWPRVLPQGSGAANAAGLDFYSRLVDALLERGIEPFATLFHWDLPQALQDRGGWPSRDTASAFVDFADQVSRRLGDRVRHWITHNEPWCSGLLGHQLGRHAPGLQDWPAALAACHHILLSHGWAVPVLRSNSPGARVGIALNLTPVMPASPSAADRDLARHLDGYHNRWFLDPLFGRGYPGDMVGDYRAAGHLPPEGMAFVRDGDLEAIAAALDFVGVNYYNRVIARSAALSEVENLPPTLQAAPPSEWTEMGWEVYPEGLFEVLVRLRSHYGVGCLFVTENGCSYSDAPDGGGRVHDERRRRFLESHLLQAHRALRAGVPLAGYFVWSLLDNFEWERGYGQRFGMCWVDYATQRRTPKQSALWYRDVCVHNGVALAQENGAPVA
jgi:beta-glucosidase